MTGADPTRLIVFAKAPVAGLAKTRLAPTLGADGAAALAARLLVHAVEAGVAAGFHPIELCTTPDAGHPIFQSLAARHGLALTWQGEGDLGQRMHRALTRSLDQGHRALLIGTDAPALDADTLLRAARSLDRHDAVFVPAFDGGYVLVGLGRTAPGLFLDMAWSHPQVMADTRQRARAAGLRWAELLAVADIDTAADLVHLPDGWLPRPASCPGRDPTHLDPLTSTGDLACSPRAAD